MHKRKHIPTTDLAYKYLKVGFLAGVTAFLTAWLGTLLLQISRVFCEDIPGYDGNSQGCPDGVGYTIPALLLAVTGGMAMLSWLLYRTGRQADASTLRRISTHVLWIASVPVSLLFTILAVMMYSVDKPWLVKVLMWLLALAILAFINLPLYASYKLPDSDKSCWLY